MQGFQVEERRPAGAKDDRTSGSWRHARRERSVVSVTDAEESEGESVFRPTREVWASYYRQLYPGHECPRNGFGAWKIATTVVSITRVSGTNMSIASLVHGRERLSSVATSGSGHGPTIRDERASGCEESPPGVRAETTPRGDDVAHRRSSNPPTRRLPPFPSPSSGYAAAGWYSWTRPPSTS